MEELEKFCNEVLENGVVNVVHSPNPIAQPQIVRRVDVVYETNESGFVIPQTCNFKLYC